jgi:hypothetical protein
MRVVWRAVIVLAVFVVMAFTISHAVMAHELLSGDTPFAEVRLASWMAGLFGGGLVAVLVGIALLIVRRGR